MHTYVGARCDGGVWWSLRDLHQLQGPELEDMIFAHIPGFNILRRSCRRPSVIVTRREALAGRLPPPPARACQWRKDAVRPLRRTR